MKVNESKSSNLPRDVCLPTSPRFTQMLQNNTGLVLFDSFRHHVQNVMHDSSSQLQVKVAFNSLLGDCLGNAFRVSPFKLSGQKIAKPSFQERNNTTQEKQPHPPPRSPKATSWSFTNRSLKKKEGLKWMKVVLRFDVMDTLCYLLVKEKC